MKGIKPSARINRAVSEISAMNVQNNDSISKLFLKVDKFWV